MHVELEIDREGLVDSIVNYCSYDEIVSFVKDIDQRSHDYELTAMLFAMLGEELARCHEATPHLEKFKPKEIIKQYGSE